MLRLHRILPIAALALAACAGDSGGIDGTTDPGGPTPASPVGTYVLKTVDGKPLPAPIGAPIVEREYTILSRALSGQLTFNANGTYEFTAQAEVVATGIEYRQPVSMQGAGTYTYDATTITLAGGGGPGTVTRSGKTLTSTVSAPAAGGGTETVTMVFSR